MSLDDFPGVIDFGEEPEESYRWSIAYCPGCGARWSTDVRTGEEVEGGVLKRSPSMIAFERQTKCGLCGSQIDVQIFDHYPTPEER